MTNLINTLYNRLVGRDAAASEITGWSDAVSSGAVNHDYLGITLVNAILNLDESVEMRQVMMAKLDSANLTVITSPRSADLSAYSTLLVLLQVERSMFGHYNNCQNIRRSCSCSRSS